ncbi:MAG TPA: ornithine cyclodeaminase family protein, partial [Methylomirabilota bacterium]|nr:ornithine cyclodeaminase family protein [Methylomirabilota bacterium]
GTTLAVGDRGLLLLMPAAIAPGPAGGGALGTKLVTFYDGNRARGLPTHLAAYVLLEATTGRPLALLEGTWLTGLRTGATSALAARYLARPDSRRLVCFGTSAQAEHQVAALAAVLPLARVSVLGRDAGRAAAFAARLGGALGVAVDVAADAVAAVREADVVTCATTATTPLFPGDALRAGTHVDAVGAFRPEHRELDAVTLRRARVVVESHAGVPSTAGELVLALREGAIGPDHVAAELADLVSGRRPGRTSPDEITVFKSVGFALEDLAAARLAYNRAVADGVGTEVELG